jgi:electron transfer flavoprotein alpha subunit
MSKALVLIEIKDNKIRNVSYEALTAAKRVVNGGEVIACVIGNDGTNYMQLGTCHNTDNIGSISSLKCNGRFENG